MIKFKCSRIYIIIHTYAYIHILSFHEFYDIIREYKQGIDQVDYSYTPMVSNLLMN